MDSGSVALDDRDIVLVGTKEEAVDWLKHQTGDIERVTVVDRPRRLIYRQADQTHLVLLPSYFELPNYFLFRVEVSLLKQRGATVEWG